MIDKIEGTVYGKTPGLDNPETYVLTHIRYKSYLVLIFSDPTKAQIYKVPYRNSPYHEIKIFMSFEILNLFKQNKHTEDSYNRGPNDRNFLFEIEDRKYVYVGENLVSSETNDKIVKYSSEVGFNDSKFPFAYSEENL